MFDKSLVSMLYVEAGLEIEEDLGLLNHMSGVSHVAEFLAEKFNRQGVTVDSQLAATGGALHDIGKVIDRDDSKHVAVAVKFLGEEEVDPRIIQIVERHEFYVRPWGVPEPETWEEKLVLLADLCFGGNIVSMRERRRDIILRFPKDIKLKWLMQKSEEIYQEVLGVIQVFPF